MQVATLPTSPPPMVKCSGSPGGVEKKHSSSPDRRASTLNPIQQTSDLSI